MSELTWSFEDTKMCTADMRLKPSTFGNNSAGSLPAMAVTLSASTSSTSTTLQLSSTSWLENSPYAEFTWVMIIRILDKFPYHDITLHCAILMFLLILIRYTHEGLSCNWMSASCLCNICCLSVLAFLTVPASVLNTKKTIVELWAGSIITLMTWETILWSTDTCHSLPSTVYDNMIITYHDMLSSSLFLLLSILVVIIFLIDIFINSMF